MSHGELPSISASADRLQCDSLISVLIIVVWLLSIRCKEFNFQTYVEHN